VTTTTAAYLTVEQNLPRMQAMTADQPAVQTASAYYAANIGKVTSIDQFVGNYRLLSYALNAYGLGDQTNSTALIKQVLQGGVANPKALANTLTNPAWKAFAAAFDFTDNGAASISTSSAIATTTSNYVEQQLESDQGQQDPGVQLALYFQRVAPTISNSYSILGDQNLLEVVQTIFGLAPESSASNIDAEAAAISKLVPISDLQDPAKLQTLTERFTAMYDLDYGPTSGSSSSLTVSDEDASSSAGGAASSILAGVISSNGSSISSFLNSSSTGTTPLFSNSLLTSIQNFKLGG
jgi:Protein of unknown function (DUF1217)